VVKDGWKKLCVRCKEGGLGKSVKDPGKVLFFTFLGIHFVLSLVVLPLLAILVADMTLGL
jgi:hypothetical protein